MVVSRNCREEHRLLPVRRAHVFPHALLDLLPFLPTSGPSLPKGSPLTARAPTALPIDRSHSVAPLTSFKMSCLVALFDARISGGRFRGIDVLKLETVEENAKDRRKLKYRLISFRPPFEYSVRYYHHQPFPIFFYPSKKTRERNGVLRERSGTGGTEK